MLSYWVTEGDAKCLAWLPSCVLDPTKRKDIRAHKVDIHQASMQIMVSAHLWSMPWCSQSPEQKCSLTYPKKEFRKCLDSCSLGSGTLTIGAVRAWSKDRDKTHIQWWRWDRGQGSLQPLVPRSLMCLLGIAQEEGLLCPCRSVVSGCKCLGGGSCSCGSWHTLINCS